MNERDALLAAVIANPDDDTPRLVFADWLQENGDEDRAAFIREQVRHATVPQSAPQWSALYGKLERRWRKHIDRWKRELPALTGVRWGDFRRGFVESVTVSSASAFAKSGAKVFALQPVTVVHISSRKSVRTLAKCKALSRVRELQFGSYAEAGVLDPAELCAVLGSPNCPRLRSLHLGAEALPPEVAVALAECPHLTELAELAVYNNRFGDAGLAALAASPHLTGLRHLNAHTNGVTDAGVESLAASASLGGLRYLHLGDALGPAAAQSLAEAPHIKHLTSLHLSAHDLGAEGARRVAGSPNFAGLELLVLQGWRNGLGRLGPEGAAALADGPHLRRLRYLLLFASGTGDAGAVALANSPNVARVTALNLAECGLTDAGAFALAESPYLTELTEQGLCLHGNGDITAAGHRALHDRFGRGPQSAGPF